MSSTEIRRPESGTPEWALWVAAIEVASRAPNSHGATTTHAKVPWRAIEELRAALAAVGIDWRQVKRRQEDGGGLMSDESPNGDTEDAQ